MTDGDQRSEVLVSTDWVAQHLDDPTVAICEINTDLDAGYRQGHVPGAVGWDLHADLEDQVRRDIPTVSQIEALLGRSGISNDTTVVLYGDGNNRSATWGFWLLKYYRHRDVRLMDGGRRAWVDEEKPFSTETPSPTATTYQAGLPDQTIRATREYILGNLRRGSFRPLDTRTPNEYAGQVDRASGASGSEIYRQGHIPGAVLLPWDEGAADSGRFKPAEELRRMYEERGLSPEQEVVPYCRLGVRASYSWFVLKYLLGYPRVRNYDGSWTEWGNSVGVPIVTGDAPAAQ